MILLTAYRGTVHTPCGAPEQTEGGASKRRKKQKQRFLQEEFASWQMARKRPLMSGTFLEKTPKYANRVDIWRQKRYDAPNFSKYSEEESSMKRRSTAMMMCQMCMGMMSMCMFLRAQNDRLLSKNC